MTGIKVPRTRSRPDGVITPAGVEGAEKHRVRCSNGFVDGHAVHALAGAHRIGEAGHDRCW